MDLVDLGGVYESGKKRHPLKLEQFKVLEFTYEKLFLLIVLIKKLHLSLVARMWYNCYLCDYTDCNPIDEEVVVTWPQNLGGASQAVDQYPTC